MTEKIDIAEILKDKPQGTKLYNLLYNIDVELDTIVTTGTKTIVWCTDKIDNNVCKTIAYIKYIHQLQHLLFGLELNSEMKI